MTTDIRVCFLGDSLTNGLGDESCLSWTGRVCAAANSASRQVTHYNLGIRGNTSKDIRDRWWQECENRFNRPCDQRIVLTCGANDTILEANESTRLSHKESILNIRTLINEIKLKGFALLMISPFPQNDLTHNQRLIDLSMAFQKEAHQLGIDYIDVFSSLDNNPNFHQALNDYDGIHPTGTGYTIIANEIMKSPLWWF